jgi:hypothetical protein
MAVDQKPRERRVWTTTKPAFPALGAPMLPAWVHPVEDLALAKSLKSCNFTLAKAVIGWVSGYSSQAASLRRPAGAMGCVF